MDQLDQVVLFQIATMLDLDNLISLSQSSSKINRLICTRNTIWLEKLEKEFPDWREQMKEYIGNKNARKVYILLVRLTKFKEIFKYRDSIYQLFKETKIDLCCRRIKVLPSELGSLINLRELFLGSNQITVLPPEIKLLTNLKRLYLYDNQITALPSEIGLLFNLQDLSLSNNQITVLPSEIKLLTNLQNLSLNNNQITVLPSEIKLLTNLRYLSLNNNQIIALPSEIKLLTNLQVLYLDKTVTNKPSNKITNIPSNLRNIVKYV